MIAALMKVGKKQQQKQHKPSRSPEKAEKAAAENKYFAFTLYYVNDNSFFSTSTSQHVHTGVIFTKVVEIKKKNLKIQETPTQSAKKNNKR